MSDTMPVPRTTLGWLELASDSLRQAANEDDLNPSTGAIHHLITDQIADLGAGALRGYQIAEADLIDVASEVLQAAGGALVATELRAQAEDAERRTDMVVPGTSHDSSSRNTYLALAARFRVRADELDGGRTA